MATIVQIDYVREEGLVYLTDSDGGKPRPVSADDFDDPVKHAQILAEYDLPPEPEPTTEQKLADLTAQNAKLLQTLNDVIRKSGVDVPVLDDAVAATAEQLAPNSK